jgi:23S rRNA pseudoU1915 N3-methylase RlmH
MKKTGGVDAYMEELHAIIKTKKALVAKHKEENVARWSDLKSMEDEKWRSKLAAEERKVNVEERMLALEDERFAKEKKAKDHAIKFMDPNMMDAKARRYWELTREDIMN